MIYSVYYTGGEVKVFYLTNYKKLGYMNEGEYENALKLHFERNASKILLITEE